MSELKEVNKRVRELEKWIKKNYPSTIEEAKFELINVLCELLLKSKKDSAFKNLSDLEKALIGILVILTIAEKKKKLEQVKQAKEEIELKEMKKRKKSDTKK